MDAIRETIIYFQKGGLVMWPLLFCSVMVVAIAIERYLFYKSVDSGSSFAHEYCKLAVAQGMEQATSCAAKAQGSCAMLLVQAAKVNGCHMQKSAFLETQASIFLAKLRSRLDYLGVIVTMAPLLGLLGTIVGMIGAFSIFDMQSGAPLAITGGIGEALIATATGLCVAMLALSVHSYFNHRLDNIITDMEQCFSAFLEAEARNERLCAEGENNEAT